MNRRIFLTAGLLLPAAALAEFKYRKVLPSRVEAAKVTAQRRRAYEAHPLVDTMLAFVTPTGVLPYGQAITGTRVRGVRAYSADGTLDITGRGEQLAEGVSLLDLFGVGDAAAWGLTNSDDPDCLNITPNTMFEMSKTGPSDRCGGTATVSVRMGGDPLRMAVKIQCTASGKTWIEAVNLVGQEGGEYAVHKSVSPDGSTEYNMMSMDELYTVMNMDNMCGVVQGLQIAMVQCN